MLKIKEGIFNARLKLALFILKNAYSNIKIQHSDLAIEIDEHGNRKNKLVIAKTGG